jgi:GntR family transcriptional regulator, rspAB operon transcriptional repressor
MAVKTKSLKRPAASRAAKVSEASLANKAYEQIRNGILQGTLAMGDILSRRRLAEKLNMSFLPITEALQRLETEGLVESRPRIGTRVRIPTKQDILDSYVIREALETQAARLSCEKMTAPERRELMRSAQNLDKLYRTSASEKKDSRFLFSVHMYHMQFHMRIAELTRCPGLLKAIEKAQVLVFNWLYDTAAHRSSLPVHFHHDLAKELCSGDLAKADKAMRQHIRYGLDDVIESLASLETSRSWRLKRNV